MAQDPTHRPHPNLLAAVWWCGIYGVGMAPVRDETTELEAHALSLILRCPSLTAYQLRQSFAESPTRLIAMSQGTAYPLVQRLKKRGFIVAEEVPGDGRKAERLRCTAEGKDALRAWL